MYNTDAPLVTAACIPTSPTIVRVLGVAVVPIPMFPLTIILFDGALHDPAYDPIAQDPNKSSVFLDTPVPIPTGPLTINPLFGAVTLPAKEPIAALPTTSNLLKALIVPIPKFPEVVKLITVVLPVVFQYNAFVVVCLYILHRNCVSKNSMPCIELVGPVTLTYVAVVPTTSSCLATLPDC